MVKTRARTFVLTSPHMHGEDVESWQKLLNKHLRLWGVEHEIEEDGDYGDETRSWSKTVAYGLGIAQGPINAHGVTPHLRTLVRRTSLRNRTEKKRGDGRAGWRERLKKRYSLGTVGEFVAFLESHVGIHEQPSGSNLGPGNITDWERLTGYTVPSGGLGVFWCGCLQNAALVAAGFPADHLMGYCPDVEQRARNGQDGWVWRPASATPKAGWLALFDERGIAGHIEGVVKDGNPLRTVGGNTSEGNGSPNNGGMVAAHDFSKYHGLPLRGFAVPPGFPR